MDVRAMILLGTPADTFITTSSPASNDHNSETEELMGYPMGALDLLGQPVICHAIDRLRSYGITAITVLSTVEQLPQVAVKSRLPKSVRILEVVPEQIWARAEDEFLQLPKGLDSVLILRVGPYAEVDFHDFLKFHIARQNCATAVWDKVGNPLDILALDPSRKTEAAAVLRRKLRWNWSPSEMFHHDGYVNLLQHGEDFRRLAEDALMRRCALIPRGRQLKPGVWVGRRALIHRDAVVEGAAFIGEHAKIGARCALTGCSTLEHHSHIDQRTNLDNSTVLPHSYVGKNLNVVQSVVGFSKIAQVDRGVTVSIADAKLVRAIPPSSVARTLEPVRSAFSRVTERISEEFRQKQPAEVTPRTAPRLREEVADEIPQKAHAAAASASAGVKVKKRAN